MNDKTNEDLNLKAVFLGPKSENKNTFEKYLKMMFEDHSEWRKNYHPEDKEIINRKEKGQKTSKNLLIEWKMFLKNYL